jgi:hypothetical protein
MSCLQPLENRTKQLIQLHRKILKLSYRGSNEKEGEITGDCTGMDWMIWNFEGRDGD